MKVRLIIGCTKNGERETVFFLDAADREPAEDYFPANPPQDVEFDGIIEADLPAGFPLNYELVRS